MPALKLQCQTIQRPLHVFNKTLSGGRGGGRCESRIEGIVQ